MNCYLYDQRFEANPFGWKTTSHCSKCAEDTTTSITLVVIGGETICQHYVDQTITPLFKAALKNDTMFPVRWNGIELNPSSFVGLMPDNLVRAYAKKRKTFLQPIFHCNVCDDDIRGVFPSVNVAGNPVCQECFDEAVFPLLESAMENEENYPPKWGCEKIEIRPFGPMARLIPATFYFDYCKKEKEYAVLPRERVYCACDSKRFLGKATKTKQRGGVCCDCKATTCLRCRTFSFKAAAKKQGGREDWPWHWCKEYRHPISTDYLLPEDSRGKDWQMCPGEGCGAIVTLLDGCNHVECTITACSMSFCFICGQPADGSSDHWHGECPQYGHPDSERAIWNGFGPQDQDDDGGVAGGDEQDDAVGDRGHDNAAGWGGDDHEGDAGNAMDEMMREEDEIAMLLQQAFGEGVLLE